MHQAAKAKAIRNVLYATDLSQASAPAIPYVLEIAGVYGAKISVANVRTGEWTKQQQEEADRLRELFKGVPYEFVAVSAGPTALKERGDTATAILGLTGTRNIDLIAVGTHGRTGLGRVLLGSVAETVLREAPCPVLTVGPRLVGDPKWALKIKEVLFATDLSEGSGAVLEHAVSLAQENRARLIILGVMPKGESTQAISTRLERLQQLVPKEKLWREPYCLVETGDTAEEILDVAGSYKVDLIVMGVHSHGVGVATHLSRPTVHRVIAGATCGVMTVRG
jgi:nucleotide-binding universal stress UspA family protein